MRNGLAILLFFSNFVFADVTLGPITSDLREKYLKQAQVWHPTDVAHVDIAAGPRNEVSVAPGTEVTCQYVEWDAKHKPTGAMPKFLCKMVDTGEVVRIKYGKDAREIYSEVVASRLFWALGFYADDLYPVQVSCLGCPEKSPFKPEKKEKRIERHFGYAVVERNFPGINIETDPDQGWSWKELEKVDAKTGGATLEQIDALKLLAVFVQHGDNKPKQQRLACLKTDIKDPDGDGVGVCARPILMVQDLGATFGAGDQFTTNVAKFDYDAWKSKTIWNGFKERQYMSQYQKPACIGDLTNSKMGKEGVNDPVISEAGRRFLADLMMQLTDEQIRDLFTITRAETMGHAINDWIDVFKEKRRQIVERKCPERTMVADPELNKP